MHCKSEAIVHSARLDMVHENSFERFYVFGLPTWNRQSTNGSAARTSTKLHYSFERFYVFGRRTWNRQSANGSAAKTSTKLHHPGLRRFASANNRH